MTNENEHENKHDALKDIMSHLRREVQSGNPVFETKEPVVVFDLDNTLVQEKNLKEKVEPGWTLMLWCLVHKILPVIVTGRTIFDARAIATSVVSRITAEMRRNSNGFEKTIPVYYRPLAYVYSAREAEATNRQANLYKEAARYLVSKQYTILATIGDQKWDADFRSELAPRRIEHGFDEKLLKLLKLSNYPSMRDQLLTFLKTEVTRLPKSKITTSNSEELVIRCQIADLHRHLNDRFAWDDALISTLKLTERGDDVEKKKLFEMIYGLLREAVTME